MTHKSKCAFVAGSFNPFTTGHKSIVDRTLTVADSVVIGIGINAEKSGDNDSQARRAAIERVYAGDERVKVIIYTGLTVDAARSVGADFMVRGVRSCADFEYERTLAEANRDLSGIETLLLPAEPTLGFVSSSMVRDLQRHGADVSKYLP